MAANNSKTVGKYVLHETLGEGSFGKVKRAVHTETHEAVAIKILDKDQIEKQDAATQIKKEISIMRMINHPHVVGVKEVLATTTKILIVMELVRARFLSCGAAVILPDTEIVFIVRWTARSCLTRLQGKGDSTRNKRVSTCGSCATGSATATARA
jgi:serine/threonine protein kinase